jgi:hypothetical protein
MRIAANGTGVAVADVVAHVTVLHFLMHAGNGLDKALHILTILT